jgi:hypothetical protein
VRLIRRCLALLATALAFAPAAADAQLFRAYLTVDGLDTNPCNLTQPCRLLPAALAAVADGGEIWMLDSANYNTGPVSIAKSVKILAVPGVLGSIVALGGNAINIATAGVSVTLRNLNIAPFSPANAIHHGVRMTNGAQLALENVHVLDFVSGRGVWVSTPAKVSVLDSVFRNYVVGLMVAEGAQAIVSGSTFELGSYAAINVSTTVSQVASLAAISRSVISKSSAGVLAEVTVSTASARAYVHDSVLEYNNDAGVAAFVGSALTNAAADIVLGSSMVATSNSCVRASGTGARAWVSGSTINNCTNGLNATSGGLIESAGNNMVRNCGTCTTVGVTNVGTN